MGLKCSRSKRTSIEVSEKVVNERAHDYEFVELQCESEAEAKIVTRLRDEFVNDLEMFILNQVIYSTSFFKHYEKELSELLQADKQPTENYSSDNRNFKSLLPDEIFGLVNKHVFFQSVHGDDKERQQSLVTKRVFVVQENVRVLSQKRNNHERQIEKPCFNVKVVKGSYPGYVKLMYIEDMKLKTDSSSNSSKEAEASSEDDAYDKISRELKMKLLPLSEEQINNSLLPIVEVKKPNILAENDEELYFHEYYVNSERVIENFQQNWHNMGKNLGIDEEDVMQAEHHCGSIFCHVSSTNTFWEIIPAIQLSSGGYSPFCQRKKTTKAINKAITFPTNSMLNALESMSKYSVPRNRMANNFDWELTHPEAERYFQNLLSHAHLKALLMVLILHKTYIEPKTNMQGLTMRHLVTALFWELQENVVISETRMGRCLIQVLNKFYVELGHRELHDYFVESRNHFENIPSQYLRDAQRAFKQTMDAPLMRFLCALRNLGYLDEEFPRLDIKKLYELLTKKPFATTRTTRSSKAGQKIDWRTRRRRTEHRKVLQMMNVDPKAGNARKLSIEYIDCSFDVQSIQGDLVEWYTKARTLLQFFVEHYLRMAQAYHKWGNSYQAHKYLQQAKYVTYLFHNSCTQEAHTYQKQISDIRKVLERQTPSSTDSSELPNDGQDGIERVMEEDVTEEPTTKLFLRRNESEGKHIDFAVEYADSFVSEI